jgi:hypothetical protein
MKSIILLIIGIILFIVFAFDLEYDRDVMTWMWLLESVILIGFSFFIALKEEINKKINL